MGVSQAGRNSSLNRMSQSVTTTRFMTHGISEVIVSVTLKVLAVRVLV